MPKEVGFSWDPPSAPPDFASLLRPLSIQEGPGSTLVCRSALFCLFQHSPMPLVSIFDPQLKMALGSKSSPSLCRNVRGQLSDTFPGSGYLVDCCFHLRFVSLHLFHQPTNKGYTPRLPIYSPRLPLLFPHHGRPPLLVSFGPFLA